MISPDDIVFHGIFVGTFCFADVSLSFPVTGVFFAKFVATVSFFAKTCSDVAPVLRLTAFFGPATVVVVPTTAFFGPATATFTSAMVFFTPVKAVILSRFWARDLSIFEAFRRDL